jgi:hypothetical protein
VSELALVVLHPENKGWQVARLNMMDEEVAGMMEARARALAVPGNDGSAPLVVFAPVAAGDDEEDEEDRCLITGKPMFR